MGSRLMEDIVTALQRELLAKEKGMPCLKARRAIVIGEWIRAREVKAIFGLPLHRLRDLVKEHKVIAKKVDYLDPKSAVIFRTADIRKAIDDMPTYDYSITPKGVKAK